MNDDISQTTDANSEQLNADDLLGGPIDILVTGGTVSNDPQQPASIRFEGDNGKPYKPCKSMRRVLLSAWGKSVGSYAGKSMRLYRDPNVTFGKDKVGGIRISHLSHIDRDLNIPLTVSRAKRAPFHVKRMDAPQGQNQAPDPMVVAQAIQQATDAAHGGTEAFAAWWKSDTGRELRGLFGNDADEMAKIKAVATEADQAAAVTEDQPDEKEAEL